MTRSCKDCPCWEATTPAAGLGKINTNAAYELNVYGQNMRYIRNIVSYIIIVSFSLTGNGESLRNTNAKYLSAINGESLRPASTSNISARIAGLHEAISDSDFYKLSTFLDKHPAKTRVDAIESFIAQSSNTNSATMALWSVFLRKNYEREGLFAELSYYERLEFISGCLSLALRRPDSSQIYEFLKEILQTARDEILPEARKFISSYVTVYGIKEPIKVATVFSLYKGWEKIKPYSKDNPTGQDYLRKKIGQLRELYSINPNITWQLIVVQDGDDRRVPDRGRKSIEVARGIVVKDFPGLMESQHVVFLELPQHTKEMIDGAKGGAVLYGLRWAVDNGADYGISTDGTLGTHLGLEGLLLDGAVNGNRDVVIGSIYRPDSLVLQRKLGRRIRSRVWLALAKMIFPKELLRISDTQRSFKCYSKEALKLILPIDKMYNFDRHFVYNFSFDAVFLALAKKAELSIGEKGIIWIDFPALTTINFKTIFNMVKGLIKGRLFLSLYSKSYEVRARDYHISRRAKPSGDEKSPLMKGSTKAKEFYFKDIPTIDKIKLILTNYDLGTDSIKDVEFERLPGAPSRPPLLLKTPKGKFVIKYAGKDVDSVRFIISTILYLKFKKWPVAPLIESKKRSGNKIDNYWIKADENHFLIVRKYIEGEMYGRLKAKADRMARLGAFIARFHDEIAGFKPMGAKEEKRLIDVIDYQKDIDRLLDNIIATLHRKRLTDLSRGEQLFLDYCGLISQKMNDLGRYLPPAIYEGLPKSVISGDINFTNLVYYPPGKAVGGETMKAFFDWDKARIQPRVEDFKNPIMALPQGEGRTYDLESTVAMVLGYQLASKNKLTAAELTAIPEIISGTFLWICCSNFLLNMERLNTDDDFYEVAVKDLGIFKRFTSEKDLLKAILLDCNNIIKKYKLTKQDEINDELIGRIIAQKKKQFVKSTKTIKQVGDVTSGRLFDRHINLLTIGAAA